jgi:hypothetical protein
MNARLVTLTAMVVVLVGCADSPAVDVPTEVSSAETQRILDSIVEDENGALSCELGPMTTEAAPPTRLKAAFAEPDAGSSDLSCSFGGDCFACCHAGRRTTCCVACFDGPAGCRTY